MELAEILARRYADAHPRSAAARIHDLPPDGSATFLSALDPATAARVISELWITSAAAILDSMAAADSARVVEELPLVRAVALLRRVGSSRCEQVVSELPPPIQQRVRHALTLPPGTVGAAADTTVVPVDQDASVDEVRLRGSDPRLAYLYVVDDDLRLVGVLHRRDLESSDGGTRIGSIMRANVHRVAAATPLTAVRSHGAWTTLDALPVVDAGGGFVGVIRHKDLRAAPPRTQREPGPAAAITALLDLGEAYWSGLYSAIDTLSTGSVEAADGERR